MGIDTDADVPGSMVVWAVSGSEIRSGQLRYFDLRLVRLLIVSVSVEIGFVGLGKLGHYLFSFLSHQDTEEELTVDGVCPESPRLHFFMEEII
jgi:hypothetical protein